MSILNLRSHLLPDLHQLPFRSNDIAALPWASQVRLESHNTRTMTLTTRLPTELVLRVFDFVDPPALVELACTCKSLEKCSRDILRKHRASHDRYRVVTDTAPRSLTEVLRKALVDDHLAWHVRELEFTHDRMEWSHWTESDGIEGVEGPEMPDPSPPPPDYAFTQDEQANLLSQLREVFHFNEEQIAMAYEDLQHGNDAPLKLLLFGVCPRIRSVKFSRDVHLTGDGTIERASPNNAPGIPRSGLEYFHQAIVNQLQNRSAAWPPGLDSLQDLAIGVETDNETGDLTFAPSPALFANCMHLPHLDSLYCFGLEIYDDPTHYEIEKRSSSVQHIFLDTAHGHHVQMEGIITGCTQLKSLVIAGGEMEDIDAVVDYAGNCYHRSLETLMFYDTDRFSGYRSNMCRPEYIVCLRSLQTVYVDTEDVMLEAYYDYKHVENYSAGPGHLWIDDSPYFTRFCMDSAFPISTEVLVLGTRDHSYLMEGDAKLLDEALATMIEVGRVVGHDAGESGPADTATKPVTTFKGSFPSLKAIYLDSLDDKHNINEARRERWFSKAIAAGRRFGVDVHTRTARGQPFHHVDFPMPPTMTTTKFAEDVVFDIYTGKWSPPKCENCGTCEDCLRQYDASVWKEVEDELEREGDALNTSNAPASSS